jgi:ribosomal protein S18 acetylase RimI-like enzyme
MFKTKPEFSQGVSIYQSKGSDASKILQEACSIEKKSFPKHMSMSECLEREIRKPRSALLLSREETVGTLAGYALITWNGAVGSISKLVVREDFRRRGHGEKLMQVRSCPLLYSHQ